jgi:hypothetical protein
MTHPRKLIRAAIKDRLTGVEPDYPTAAQDRVFDTMTPPVNLESLVDEGPVIMAYTRNEEIRHEDYPASRLDGAVRRRLDLHIEALTVGANVDDALDDLAEQIEALLENWEPEGFKSARIELKESEINVTDVGDRIFGGLFMTYEIAYWTKYREDTDPGFLADDVSVVARFTLPPEPIVDDDEDGVP